MSLASLNYPPLVASAGAGLFVLLPHLEEAVTRGAVSWSALKAANFVSFAINVLAVSRPGRIDGDTGKYHEDLGNETSEDSEIEQLSPGKRGRTLVSPAGWAFAIWGPIYLGEMSLAVSQLFLSESSSLAPLLKGIAAPFCVANLMQSLWTAAFRPKYYKDNNMFVSAGLLAGTAYSMSRVHSVSTSFSSSNDGVHYMIYVLPTTLHFGWTLAASLVNLNGAVAMKDTASAKTVAWLGHASVVAASAAGVVITIGRSAPVFGGVISWALFAVADGMKKRHKQTAMEDPDRVGVYGVRVQERLSTMGALTCAAVSLFVGGKLVFSRKK